MRDYEPDVSQIIALYQQLEDDIISDMARRMLKMGFVSESTVYQAEVLQAAGILYEDILQMIAERTDASVQQVKALFEDAGVNTVEIDNEVHESAGEVPVDIRQNASMKQVLEEGYKKTLGTMQNLVSTTASTTQAAFVNACDRAYMQVSSGAFSYQQAIRMAVQNLADTGAYITYPSGHRDRIDVAVRRAVLTGIGQTSSAVAKKHAEDASCHLMELTAHSGARPEHARWQGQLVTTTGEDAGKTIDGMYVFTLREIGYGDGDGFKGWNCRHNWHPYYKGLSKPNYTPDQLKKLDEKSIEWGGKKYTEYEISQMQRTAERKVRALKRRTLATHEAIHSAPDEDTKLVLETSYMDSAVKLKAAERHLKEFCNQTGRRNDTFRTQVQGFGRSEAQKAVQAAKKAEKVLPNSENFDILKANKYLDARPKLEKHDIIDCYDTTNPKYNTSRAYCINCQRCVAAYEARRRGVDVVAKPAILDGTDRLPYMMDKKGWANVYQDGLESIETVPGKTGTAVQKNICARMAEYGDGTRAIVRVQWQSGGGHVFIAEQYHGNTIFLDPQSGDIDVSRYFNKGMIKPSKTRLLRIDDKAFTDLIEQCAE